MVILNLKPITRIDNIEVTAYLQDYEGNVLTVDDYDFLQILEKAV